MNTAVVTTTSNSLPENSSVLIVDDHPDYRQSLEDLLALEFPGLKVLTAESGPEGLTKAERAGKNLILIAIDQRMPGMSGVQFIEEINRKGFGRVRKVIISGLQPDYIKQQNPELAELGITILTKPKELDILLIIIRAIQKRLQATA